MALVKGRKKLALIATWLWAKITRTCEKSCENKAVS